MEKVEAGYVEELEVVTEEEYGYFLSTGKENILLHENEINGTIEVGDHLKVFTYVDKQGRLAATMTIPNIQRGTYDWAEVVEVKKNLGVFVNIGIQKEILVSLDDLPDFRSCWPEVGDKLFVTLSLDKKGRLLAIPATEEVILDNAKVATSEMRNKNISGRIYRLLSVGCSMISDEGYRCFIHEDERKEEPRLGELVNGRVIGVKEDGTLNVSLLPRKQESMDEDSAKIFKFMEARGGAMPYSDKSDPNDIQMDFGISKSSFKRALGKLMKDEKVYQEDGWTYFIDKK